MNAAMIPGPSQQPQSPLRVSVVLSIKLFLPFSPLSGHAVVCYLEHDVLQSFLVSYNGLTDHRAQAFQEVNLRPNEESGM